MKKAILFTCLAIAVIILGSCKSKQSEEANEETTKVAYNESIQGTFYGVSFGAQKDEVIEKFEKKGLYPDYGTSTDTWLVFKPYSNKFSFGDLDWNHLYVVMSNGRFCGIRFFVILTIKRKRYQVVKL